MWWNVGPHLKRRQRQESGDGNGWRGSSAALLTGGTTHKSNSFFHADTDIEEFRHLLKSNFGTLCRSWRLALDADESGLLDFREFSIALQGIGYQGNMRTLWFNLDDRQTGTICLREIDPKAYHALEKFRVMACRKYGGMMNCWDQLLDPDHSGTVSSAEFHTMMQELGYESEEETEDLFGYLLLKPGIRFITKFDVQFLQTWEDTKQASAMRSRLPCSWVNKDPFMGSPRKAGSQASGLMSQNPSMATLPTNGGTNAEQSAVDPEDYGSITAFDPEGQKEAFRQFLINKYGTLPKAFDIMDEKGTGSIALTDFQAVVSTVLRYCRRSDASRLFFSFETGMAQGRLTWEELGIGRHVWANHVLEKRTMRLLLEAEKRGGTKSLAPGSSPRQVRSKSCHHDRIRNVNRRNDVAFGMPLPKGWGFPVDGFVPRDQAVKLPPLSAR